MLMWKTIDDTVYACPAPVHRDNVLDLKTLTTKSYTEEMPRRWIVADTTSGKTLLFLISAAYTSGWDSWDATQIIKKYMNGEVTILMSQIAPDGFDLEEWNGIFYV